MTIEILGRPELFEDKNGPQLWVDEAIWGHRHHDEQSPWLTFKEFLTVLLAEHKAGRTLVEGTLNSLSYRPQVQLKLRNIMQVTIGYFFGYCVIAFVLLPLYYRLNLTSIYNYLQKRFGNVAYKTGALFFIISRTVGATARLYLVINILQFFILDQMGVPFIVTASFILLMILLYTFEGGVKTIGYTDTLQTSLMVAGLIVCVVYILTHLGISGSEAFVQMSDQGYLNVFNTDVNSKGFFVKQILGGAFIAIAMSGLAQGSRRRVPLRHHRRRDDRRRRAPAQPHRPAEADGLDE